MTTSIAASEIKPGDFFIVGEEWRRAVRITRNGKRLELLHARIGSNHDFRTEEFNRSDLVSVPMDSPRNEQDMRRTLRDE